MNVFVSSVIVEMGDFREAAGRAGRTLGHEVKRSEDFPAMAESPQQACLAGVREADVVVLLLGARYGEPLTSGLSATHEEYREARGRRPVLAFVQKGINPEPAQRAFLDEVRQWQGGEVTADFTSPEDLQEAITRALHIFELSRHAGEVDEAEMLERARSLLPDRRGFVGASLVTVIVGGPRQSVLRPAELEDPGLERDVLREALVGPSAVLSPATGTSTVRSEGRFALEQKDAHVMIDDLGSIITIQPPREDDRSAVSMPALIEEDVRDRIDRALGLSGLVMEQIDAVHRLSEILPLLSLSGTSYMGWRTRAEQAQSPSSMQIPNTSDPQVVMLNPVTRPRAALLHGKEGLVDDFLSVLRRRFRS